MDSRRSGGVAMSERSRSAESARFRVRGIGGRGQGQHVHLGPEGLEPFLLAHPEAVLLVDDDEAEPPEAHVVLEQAMRADDDVDPPFAELAGDLLAVAARTEARELLDAHRPFGEAVAERLVVLLREQGGGNEERDLPSLHGRRERGPHRDLRLAEPHVPAHEAVHRPVASKVVQGRADRGCLVGGLLEGEAFGEGGVLPVVEGDRVAGPRRAPGLDLEELRGDVAHPFGRRLAGLLPLRAAELVEGRALGPRVARHEVQGQDRDVELVAVRVLEVEVLPGDPGRGEGDEPPVAPDPVALVHHRIPRLKLGEVADDALHVTGAGAPPAGRRGPAAEEERLGKDRDGRVVEDRAPLDLGEDDPEPPFLGIVEEGGPTGEPVGAEVVAPQGLDEGLHPARRLDEEQDPAREPFEELLEERERLGCARVGGEGGGVRGPEPGPPAGP